MVYKQLKKIKDANAKGEVYDALLLDWKMPNLDGLQTTRRIHEICGNKMLVLIISEYDWSDIESETIAAGVKGFLSKPLFVSTLCYGFQKYVLKKQEDVLNSTLEINQIDFTGKHVLLV